MAAAGTNAGAMDGTPALVTLHGFALDARMWRPQVEALGEDHRFLLLDLPGFGPQARDSGVVEPTKEIARAMDATKLARAHLVACSYGAAVAVDYALRFPERALSLVLVSPMLIGRRMAVDSWQRCVGLANEGDKTTAAEVWLDDPMFETLRQDEDLFDEVRGIVLDYGGGHWTGKITTVWAEPDPMPRLGELRVPTLIVSGARDLPSFLQTAEAYAKAIPNARHETVPESGHHVSLEAPDAFNELLRTFVQQVGA